MSTSVVIPVRNKPTIQHAIKNILKNKDVNDIVVYLDDYWPDPPIEDNDNVTIIHSSIQVGLEQATVEAKRFIKNEMVIINHEFYQKNGRNDPSIGDITILYYTANKVPEKFASKICDQIRYAGKDIPIISISQKPVSDMGENICVGDIGQSLQNIYRQILEGAKKAKTEYIICCEDDTLYVPEHFKYRPTKPFAYNLNRWNLHTHNDLYTYRRRTVMSQCIAKRDVLIECLEERFKLDEIPKKHCGEPGIFEKRLGIKTYEYETFETAEPNVVVAHDNNTTGHKLQGKDAEPKTDLQPWGNGKSLLDHIYRTPVKPKVKKKRGMPQHNYIKELVLSIDDLRENRMDFVEAGEKKRKSLVWFMKVYPPFIQRIASGEDLTKEKLMADPYYEYLLSKLNPADRIPEYTNKGKRHCVALMQDSIKLYNDMKQYGLKAPLDMWQAHGRFVLFRGGRRVEILHALGYKKVPARVFKTKEIFQKFAPGKDVPWGDIEYDSIHHVAMKQFVDLQEMATDKYWVHGYTPIYDKEIGHLRYNELKILECGVLRGASLLLWKAAFPRSKIYGLDKDATTWHEMLLGKDINVFVGNQEDQEFLNKCVIREGPYDIIIDDASHKPRLQRDLLKALWPAVSPNGVYVIEDMHWNYHSGYRPDAIDEVRKMVDDIYNDPTVEKISFYYNICFIHKK